MTASPPLNGHTRSPIRIVGDWQPVTPEPAEEQRSPQPEPAVDAEVARARAWAEAEERRVAAEAEKEERLLKAQAEADAIRVKAEEDARRLRLANDRQERKAREEEEASEARIAESRRKRDEADRARERDARQAAEQQQSEQQAAKEITDADEKWRSYAIRFAIVCGIVSLPVQMSFFWNPHAPWMAAAPVMLEGAAWVVHRGARAAAVSKRPVWHYRAIVWLLALIAAAINLYHGLHAFDPGTALATAFASVAGPGVWDLHEHGRIRKRDGVLTRRERKAQRKQERAEAARKAAEEKRIAAEKEAADKAAAEAAEKLAAARAEKFPKVWEHALKIAAALGETTVTEAVWDRAHRDVEGAPPADSADVIRMRNAAEARVAAATEKRSVNGMLMQVDQQMPRRSRRGHVGGPTVRGVRRPNDTERYTPGARRQAAITAKNTAEKKGGKG
jgi:hypothetical protein